MMPNPLISPYTTLVPGNSSDPSVNRQMAEMFDHLNLQLRQLHRPGYGQQPIPRQFSNPEGGYDFSDGLPPIPQERIQIQKPKPSLPPYMDPNSI
jgi:hypothetical protein